MIDPRTGPAAPPKGAGRRHRDPQYDQMIVGLLLVLVGLVILAGIGGFLLQSEVVGGHLVAQERHAIAAAGHGASRSSCAAPSDTSTSPQGLLEAKAIGLDAPVMGGDADAQLNVAVGHVPGSSWPGQAGTAVLAAHDVTYFSDLAGLRAGAAVEFLTRCATYVYRVTGHEVVTAGSPLYSSPDQSVLVLETCWPTDALFYTDQRYLLTAAPVSTEPTGAPIPALRAPTAPTVPVPSQLASQGLTLATNATPMGIEQFAGDPSSSWRQSAAPFADEAAVLTAYFGAVHAAEQDEAGWWAALAPSVPVSAAAPLAGADIALYSTPLDVTLVATGATLTGADLHASVVLTGGSAPGTYQLAVGLAVHAGVLRITGWQLSGSTSG